MGFADFTDITPGVSRRFREIHIKILTELPGGVPDGTKNIVLVFFVSRFGVQNEIVFHCLLFS